MATFSLPYDRTTVEVALPDNAKVETLSPCLMEPLVDPKAELMSALDSPIDSPPLRKLASGMSGRVLLIVQDHTRVGGRHIVLPWILDFLNDMGVADERITVLVALGTHKAPSRDVIRKITGPAWDRVEVVAHDASGPMLDRGITSRGTPMLVNPLLEEAGLVITYGSVVHHYFAGFGGGRKLILPGISSLETISANHSLVWADPKGTGGRHPMARSGILDGNPVHEDMLEAACLALSDTPCFAIMSVVRSESEICFLAAGSMENAHRKACEFVDRSNVVEIEEPADVVIASAGGYPKDANVIQSHKGMDNASYALKPGGTMLFLMACADGTGNPAIEEFAPLDLDQIRARLAEHYAINGQTVHSLKEKARKFRIVCLSRLDPELMKTLWLHPARDIGEAREMLRKEIESADLIYHVPRADITLPRRA